MVFLIKLEMFGVRCSKPASPSTVQGAIGFHKIESLKNFLLEIVPIASVKVEGFK